MMQLLQRQNQTFQIRSKYEMKLKLKLKCTHICAQNASYIAVLKRAFDSYYFIPSVSFY